MMEFSYAHLQGRIIREAGEAEASGPRPVRYK